MGKRRSELSTPRREKGMERNFVCVDCQAMVFDFSGDADVLRDKCYNCTFVSRVADSAEHEAELRRVLGCERRERDGNCGV